jgi:hypothetical protein
MGLFLRDDEAPLPTNRARPARFDAHRAITASAERIDLAKLTPAQSNRTYQEWQQAAWTGYRRVGEIHYGFGLLANLLSRIRFYPAVLGEANETPTDLGMIDGGDDRISEALDQAATAAMSEITGEDFTSFARKFSLNMSVPGECYLVDMPEDGWMICSTTEITVRPGSAIYTPMRGEAPRTLPPGTFIARIWRQDPEYTKEADSSMMGVADAVEELLLCQRLTRGAARARMNNGILFLPDGITVARTAPTGEPVLEEPEDSLNNLAAMSQVDPGQDVVANLMDSMVTPISDEASASSVVPLVLVGQTDQGSAIRHIDLRSTQTDEWLIKRAEVALDRILQGIDIPKEVVTGMQAVKYSNAVVIDENLYKANIEPLALVLADSLAGVYLKPVLKAQGFTDAEMAKLVVWYDPSEIVTRPNSAESANQGLDRGVLSARAWRRENGYAESDAPNPEERAMALLAKNGSLPERVLVQLLAKALKGYVEVDEEPEAEVKQFPQAVPDRGRDTEKDPQRVAVQQVGLK